MMYRPCRLALAALLAVTAGCSYPHLGRPLERAGGVLGLTGPGEAFAPPQLRMGVMPFDVWYCRLEPLGPDRLGTHRYIPAGGLPAWVGEESRGVVYTTRGGFLDMAHIRNSIDLTRYAYVNLMDALDAGRDELDMLSAEPDMYHVKLTPPKRWASLQQQRLAAVRLAGRLAYLMTTWHEVNTWFGYSGIVVSERPSAFSYDDAPSHMVGVIAAMRALEKQPLLTQFNQTVSAELSDYLRELGAVSPDQAIVAAAESKAAGWADLIPERRLIHLGLEGEVMHPMLLDSMPHHDPVVWKWPVDETVMGLQLNDLYDVAIDTATFQGGTIRRAAGLKDRGQPIHPRSHFPALLRTLKAQRMP